MLCFGCLIVYSEIHLLKVLEAQHVWVISLLANYNMKVLQKIFWKYESNATNNNPPQQS